MIGISKKRLREIVENYCDQRIEAEIEWLIEYECEELNPWLPIDENTPKDRELLLLYSDKTKVVGVWHKDKGFDMYDDWLCKTITATHYQELPDDPEDFIC